MEGMEPWGGPGRSSPAFAPGGGVDHAGSSGRVACGAQRELTEGGESSPRLRQLPGRRTAPLGTSSFAVLCGAAVERLVGRQDGGCGLTYFVLRS